MTLKPYQQRKLDKLSAADRLDTAKRRTRKLIVHLARLKQMEASNEIILYSETLEVQIPRSTAAVHFNMFRKAVYYHALIRLSAVWDAYGDDRESIPTIIKLVETAEVRDKLSISSRADLLEATEKYAEISDGQKLKSLLEHRSQYIAHNLEEGYKKEEEAIVKGFRHGDEKMLLSKAIEIADHLHAALNNTTFSWSFLDADAEAAAFDLWSDCTFNVTR